MGVTADFIIERRQCNSCVNFVDLTNYNPTSRPLTNMYGAAADMNVGHTFSTDFVDVLDTKDQPTNTYLQFAGIAGSEEAVWEWTAAQ